MSDAHVTLSRQRGVSEVSLLTRRNSTLPATQNAAPWIKAVNFRRGVIALTLPTSLRTRIRDRLDEGQAITAGRFPATCKASLPVAALFRGGRRSVQAGMQLTASPDPMLIAALLTVHAMLFRNSAGHQPVPIICQSPRHCGTTSGKKPASGRPQGERDFAAENGRSKARQKTALNHPLTGAGNSCLGGVNHRRLLAGLGSGDDDFNLVIRACQFCFASSTGRCVGIGNHMARSASHGPAQRAVPGI